MIWFLSFAIIMGSSGSAGTTYVAVQVKMPSEAVCRQVLEVNNFPMGECRSFAEGGK